MRLLGYLSLTLTLSLLVGCDAAAPEDVPAGTASPSAQVAALQVALDDVLVRVLPAIDDAAGVAPLEAHTAELVSALTAGDASRLSQALEAAQAALDHLAGSPGTGEEHGADLGAVQLVLDELATLLEPSAPLSGTGSR